MIPNPLIYQAIEEHMKHSLMDNKLIKRIIIHKSTFVIIQVIGMLPISKIMSNPGTNHNNLTRYNRINFSHKSTEDFKDMNMVLNKTKHTIQQRAGFKEENKSITISMDKSIMS